MLEWEILEDEERTLPPLVEERPQPRWQQWWPGLALWVLLLGLLGGMFWWRARQQEQAIRADLQATINTETRVMAFGEPTEAMRFVEELSDPAAPERWRNLYWYQFARERAEREPPRLGQVVMLQENGTLALVEVIWTFPEETPGRRGATEERAYRLVDGSWRRTPLIIEDGEKEEVRMEHFTLIGPPETIDALAGDGSLGLKLDGLWEHLNVEWPEGWLATERVYLNVEPSELGFLIDRPTNMRTILINAPERSVSQIVLEWPLSVDAQYRLRVTSEVIWRLMIEQMGSGLLGERAFTFSGILGELQEAEARHWSLSEAERRALRNYWRGELDGEWLSPFQGAIFRVVVNTPRQIEQREQRRLTMALTLEYLVETEGIEVLGQMAHILAERRPDFATLCLEITGGTLEELEAEVREYSLRTEE